MPSNLNGLACRLNAEFPNRLGIILSPGGWADPRGLPYTLDNGRFSVWSKGKQWQEELFLSHLNKATEIGYHPLWLVVPDTVADAEATYRDWQKWHPILQRYYWPLAMAVQDGMTPTSIMQIRPLPEVIFVGGSTEWKWKHLRKWCRTFPRVHVGRVNTGGLLWKAHRCGVESSDGTGWWHVRQLRQLRRYLHRSQRGLPESKIRGFS